MEQHFRDNMKFIEILQAKIQPMKFNVKCNFLGFFVYKISLEVARFIKWQKNMNFSQSPSMLEFIDSIIVDNLAEHSNGQTITFRSPPCNS